MTLLPDTEEDEDNDDDTIRISLEALHTSIEQIKLLRAGKIQGRPIGELWAELEEDGMED